jgi:tetratricopeptide (TPR) repeat protein
LPKPETLRGQAPTECQHQRPCIEPDNAAVQFFYGAKAVASGRLDAGILALERATELDPEDPAKARMFALALIKRGRAVGDDVPLNEDYVRAAAVAAKMAEAEPTYSNLMLQCSAELGAREYGKAVETSKAAMAANPTDWLAHYYLGQAYSGSGQYAAAEEPLRNALERAGPEDQRVVWRQLGWIYEKQSKPAEAAEAYRRAEGRTGDGTAAAQPEVKADPAAAEIEARRHRLMEMKREAEQIEQELKKLEASPK